MGVSGSFILAADNSNDNVDCGMVSKMEKLWILRLVGACITGFFYAKASVEIRPIVAVIGTWGAIVCIYLAKGG